MQQPSVQLFGITIQEPIVTLTDLIVATVCFVSFVILNKQKRTDLVFVISKYSMFLLGSATLLGGILGHAFNYALGKEWKLIGWLISMISVAMFERAAIFYARRHMRNNLSKIFSALNIVELIVLISLTIYTLNFHLVEVHGLYGMLIVVASFHGYVYSKTKDVASKNILIGVIFCSLAAAAHVFKITFSVWFNHLDLGHIMLAISCFYFHKGFMNLQITDK
jgi:hypothetical protein